MGNEGNKGTDPSFGTALRPALLTVLAMTLVVMVVIVSAEGDPLALARLGTRFRDGIANGTEGYDGQFVYYIALELNPEVVRPHLDVPAYRYQRILLPLLARLVSLGKDRIIAWALPVLGLLAHGAGTWAVAALFLHWGRSAWYALIYGLWVGFSLALRLDLPEPIAYALVAGAIYATIRGRSRLGWVLYGLALFAKEVTAIFLLAQLLEDSRGRKWQNVAGLLGVAVLPFLFFQAWLWAVFGSPGIGSGGAYATRFEWIPFWGFLQLGLENLALLAVYLLVFGPVVLLPAVWGIWRGGRDLMGGRDGLLSLGLLLNGLVIAFLPFSTFREPGGLLRFASGLILAILLYAARFGLRRILNYGWFTIFLNAFLIELRAF